MLPVQLQLAASDPTSKAQADELHLGEALAQRAGVASFVAAMNRWRLMTTPSAVHNMPCSALGRLRSSNLRWAMLSKVYRICHKMISAVISKACGHDLPCQVELLLAGRCSSFCACCKDSEHAQAAAPA